jgi:parallel beta-helix repeat protein
LGGDKLLKQFGLFVFWCSALSGVAHASTYYVSNTGSNSNSCTQAKSTSSPKQTLAAGLGCLGAGDTLLVRGGTYNEEINNNVPSGTSWNNPVRIATYPGETVWITPQPGTGSGRTIYLNQNQQYIELDGLNLDASRIPYGAVGIVPADFASGTGPHHIRLQNAEVINSSGSNAQAFGAITVGVAPGQPGGFELINLKIHGGGNGQAGYYGMSYGVYLASSNSLIDGCDIYDTSGAGIHIYSGSAAIGDNIVRNSRIHDLTRSAAGDSRLWGILVSGTNNQIYNNVIYGLRFPYASSNAGIYVYYGSGTKIYNNTITSNTTDGIYINDMASSSEVKNNIVYAVAGSNFDNRGSGTAQSNNLLGVDPLFVNPSANNYQLQSGSSAVDAGARLTSVTTDFAGVPRPEGAAQDIGAYEYRPAQTASPPPSPSGLHIVAN